MVIKHFTAHCMIVWETNLNPIWKTAGEGLQTATTAQPDRVSGSLKSQIQSLMILLFCVSVNKPDVLIFWWWSHLSSEAPLILYHNNCKSRKNFLLTRMYNSYQSTQWLSSPATMELGVDVQTEDVVNVVTKLLLYQRLDELHPASWDLLPTVGAGHWTHHQLQVEQPAKRSVL